MSKIKNYDPNISIRKNNIISNELNNSVASDSCNKSEEIRITNNVTNNFYNNENLTEFEKELLDAFKEFDIDGNGVIDKDEFSGFMHKLGYKPTIVELQEMLDEVDKDKNGKIGFNEFKYLMTKTIKDEFTQCSSIEAFSVFDRHKIGKISKDELINILLTKGDNPMDSSEVQDLVKYVQFDNDNYINYSEFVKNTFDLFN